MDGAEYTWDLGESALASFMSSYPPVPEHLKKRRDAGEGDRGDETVDLGENIDTAGVEEDPGTEDEGVLEADPSDEALLHMSGDRDVAGDLTTGVSRPRRRLVKDGGYVSHRGPGATFSREPSLHIPVSGVYILYSFLVVLL